MERVLRSNNNITVYNYSGITDRLQRATKGDMFIAFNGFTERYELHSVKSFMLQKGQSVQASWESTELLSEWLIRDIKANSIKKFRGEIEGTRAYLENLYEEHENKRSKQINDRALQSVETVLGRRL